MLVWTRLGLSKPTTRIFEDKNSLDTFDFHYQNLVGWIHVGSILIRLSHLLCIAGDPLPTL